MADKFGPDKQVGYVRCEKCRDIVRQDDSLTPEIWLERRNKKIHDEGELLKRAFLKREKAELEKAERLAERIRELGVFPKQQLSLF